VICFHDESPFTSIVLFPYLLPLGKYAKQNAFPAPRKRRIIPGRSLVMELFKKQGFGGEFGHVQAGRMPGHKAENPIRRDRGDIGLDRKSPTKIGLL
jgi:hypothetical protein